MICLNVSDCLLCERFFYSLSLILVTVNWYTWCYDNVWAKHEYNTKSSEKPINNWWVYTIQIKFWTLILQRTRFSHNVSCFNLFIYSDYALSGVTQYTHYTVYIPTNGFKPIFKEKGLNLDSLEKCGAK